MTFKQDLEQLRKLNYQEKYPSTKERWEDRWSNVVKMKPPQSAAATERLVVEFMRLSGHSASKVATQGTYKKGETYQTPVGKIIGEGRYLPSGGRKGASDISSSIYGLSVMWELKYSKSDSQSPEQKKFQKEIEQSGGLYFLFNNINHFYELYQDLIQRPQLIMMREYCKANG